MLNMVVNDVRDAAEKLERVIGIGPFEIFDPDYGDLTFKGNVGKFKSSIGLCCG